MEIKDARSLSASAQEALRRRAVQASLEGKTQEEVCRLFHVSRSALNSWLSAYRQFGEAGLTARKKGRPSALILKPWQASAISRLITEKLPDQLKLPFALWTREAVAQLIEMKFGFRLSLMTVGRYLKRWGFTPQKPAKRALEQSPEAVKYWLKTTYPLIRKQAHQEAAEIQWGDEMGLRSDHQAGRTYGRKGQTPVIPSPGCRFGCNVISTISNRGTLRFMVYEGSFNAKIFITLLTRLLKAMKSKKVFLIVDHHRVHHSRKVTHWLEDHKDQIRLFFLPPYSPQLNPDEMLNNDVKANAVGRKRAQDPEELLRNVRGFLKRKQRHPEAVKKYFHPALVRYAA